VAQIGRDCVPAGDHALFVLVRPFLDGPTVFSTPPPCHVSQWQVGGLSNGRIAFNDMSDVLDDRCTWVRWIGNTVLDDPVVLVVMNHHECWALPGRHRPLDNRAKRWREPSVSERKWYVALNVHFDNRPSPDTQGKRHGGVHGDAGEDDHRTDSS
jgi:hypothetical protein